MSPTAAFAAVGLFSLAPAAVAASPPNDDFADREVLTGALPIEVERSNVGAMKEDEEPLVGFAAAGRSVWFEWEAGADGWVTVGSCNADFANIVGVYTGTAVNSLTRVVEGNHTEGPYCPFGQREYTFKAVSGTSYAIAVDGNAFSFPEGPPADTEGAFELRIEATPVPLNDDFASATTIVTDFEEEFEGKAFYFDSAFGYNWNASVQADEPAHVGGAYEASVWYSWTTPASGEARIAVCCGPNLGQTIYVGDSLKAVAVLFGGAGPSASANFMATEGTTYRTAVYGLVDDSSGEARPASFSVQTSLRSPVPVRPSTEPALTARPQDAVAPDTAIAKRTVRTMKRRATFSFRASEQGSTFRCKLDKRPFAPCASPRSYRRLSPGRHVFKVAAVDLSGNVDPWPAVARFRIPVG